MLTIQDRICHITDDSIDKYEGWTGFCLTEDEKSRLQDFMSFLMNEYEAIPLSGITREDVIDVVEAKYDHTPSNNEQDEVLTLLRGAEEGWLEDELAWIMPQVFGEE